MTGVTSLMREFKSTVRGFGGQCCDGCHLTDERVQKYGERIRRAVL